MNFFAKYSLRRRAKEAGRVLEVDDGSVDLDLGSTKADIVKRRGTRPTLVELGQDGEDPGTSRVKYIGGNIAGHFLTKDFFITMVSLDLYVIFFITALVFITGFFFWSGWYYLLMRIHSGCFTGPSEDYVDALLFSVVTQMTIGYGNTAPDSCWPATWLVLIQSVLGIVMDAVTLGIIFAKISHPHQRSRSIFVSNKAVISRRDGILKFMFRIADLRNAQVVEPKVRAYLYTWGEGRKTAEEEKIPVRVESIELDYIDGMLLLPLIIEHTIDERSPLCGHTFDSLVAMRAEVVVTFEGTTELGNPFMTRRSYVPEEIFWGHQFVNVVQIPRDPSHLYVVDLEKFHTIEPQSGLPILPKSQLSHLVVSRSKKTVPYPLLGENTLVLSDTLCVAPNERGNMCLYCRVGDTYPDQMVEIIAKIYLYRWRPMSDPNSSREAAPAGETFHLEMLSCGYRDGSDRVHLRLPQLVVHEIDGSSPLRNWLDEGGLEQDATTEITVVINAYKFTNGGNMLRQRTYRVNSHIRYGYGFAPMVKHPMMSVDRKPRVRWQLFHETKKASGMEAFPKPPKFLVRSPEQEKRTSDELQRGEESNLERYFANFGKETFRASDLDNRSISRELRKFLENSLDEATTMPSMPALHPSLSMPGSSLVDALAANELSVGAGADLNRYNAAVGTDTLPTTDPKKPSFTPLPTDFREVATEAHLEMKRIESQAQLASPSSDYDEEAAGPIRENDPDPHKRSLSIFTNLLIEGQEAEAGREKTEGGGQA